MANDEDPLYLAVAEELAASIAAGQLPARSRVPSVRSLARQRGISINTAVASLRVLERRGLIEARPRSGYFIAARREPPPLPAAVSLPRTARLAGTRAMLRRLADASLDPAIVRLGEALPDPQLFPHAALRASLARVARRTPLQLATYPRRRDGSPALLAQVAAHYGRIGAWLDAGELVITNGCMEALALALRAVARPGDTIAVESPTYFGFLQLAEDLGVKVLEVPMHPEQGISIPALRELLAGRAGREVRACVTIANFSNPTGALLPEARKRELVRLCREADIALIEDDIYGDLALDGSRPKPCKAFDTDGRVLLCSSFSKMLAPGARVGYIAAGRHAEEVRAMKQVISGATAMLPQEMLADYLAAGRLARHLSRLRARCAAQLARLSGLVQDHFPPGTRLSRPRGGFVLWAELPGEVDTLALYERARGAGIDYVPGALFSASGRYRNCLRLNAGFPVTADTERAIARLGALLSGR
jgi:DNA-binding transcriptional MocR family regulator